MQNKMPVGNIRKRYCIKTKHLFENIFKQVLFLCPRPDLNRHAVWGQGILSPSCLPISPPGQCVFNYYLCNTYRSLTKKAYNLLFVILNLIQNPRYRCGFQIAVWNDGRRENIYIIAFRLRPGWELNPRIKLLQSFALPLGYQAFHLLRGYSIL